eukprot:scaffold7250_cov131-Cylindrotheca_fusiformis.AAC.4
MESSRTSRSFGVRFEHAIVSFSLCQVEPAPLERIFVPCPVVVDTIIMVLDKKKVVIAGATGSVGRLLVQTCLKDPRVDSVTAVVRNAISNDQAEQLWGIAATDTASQKKTPSKLTQVLVDFPSLDPEDAKLKERFQGADAFLSGLGLYSGKSTETEMDLVEGQYNRKLATIVKEAGATRGAYLSGQGVKQPSTEGRAMAMFGRVKGRAEEGLAAVFSGENQAHVSARPGAIFDRPGEPVYGRLETMLGNWPFSKLKETRFGISAPDIAKGMVQGALFDGQSHVKGNTIWDNEDIRQAARRYEQQFEDD